MKQIIKDVLDDMSNSQVNLGSSAARKMVSTLISTALESKGCYTEYDDSEIEEQNARATWVCSICGENTADVDYDYLGSGTNHLGCELKSQEDIDEYIEDIDEQAYAQGRGSSLYEDPGDGSLQLVTDEEKEQMWVDKLVEEVIDDNDTNYIYESPDSGKTVYRRKIGSSERELVKDWKTISGQSKAK